MTEKTQELLNCPFCGGGCVGWGFYDLHEARMHYVFCLSCRAKIERGNDKPAAIAAWNRRAPQCEKE